MEKAKADFMVEFRASQSFIDACAVYYGEGFYDNLKQVGPVYPNLDLSKIFMDDLVPVTPVGDDIISEKTDDSTHTEHARKMTVWSLRNLLLRDPSFPWSHLLKILP